MRVATDPPRPRRRALLAGLVLVGVVAVVAVAAILVWPGRGNAPTVQAVTPVTSATPDRPQTNGTGQGVTGQRPGPVEPAGDCGLDATGGLVERTVDGRRYLLHVPDGLDGPSVPLLLAFHGLGDTPELFAGVSGWAETADARGFAVAFPAGENGSWGFAPGATDVTFARAVAQDVASTWCVDPARVFADGYSNGGFLSQRLVCDAPGTFAAAAVLAGGDPAGDWPIPGLGGPCEPERPVAVMVAHGNADVSVPPEIGWAALDAWVRRSGCGALTVVEETTAARVETATCEGGVDVRWRELPGQPHLYPQGEARVALHEDIWSFLTAHPRP